MDYKEGSQQFAVRHVGKRLSEGFMLEDTARSMPLNGYMAAPVAGENRPYRTNNFMSEKRLNLNFNNDIWAMKQTMGDLMR